MTDDRKDEHRTSNIQRPTSNKKQKTEDRDQQSKNLEYLRDCLLNGTVSIMGCLKQIELCLTCMTKALNTYEQDLGDV